MVRIQKCRNSCGHDITVQVDESDNKWKPYDVNAVGEIIGRHQCPKSPYFTQGTGAAAKPIGQTTSFVKKPIETSAVVGSSSEELDVKRIRVVLNEVLTAISEVRKDIQVFREEVANNKQIDTNRYEGLVSQFIEILQKQERLPGTTTASDLFMKTRHDEKAESEQFGSTN